MKVFIGALAAALAPIMISVGAPWAKGFCTGARECPLTVAVADAQKAWTACLVASTAIQIKTTEDHNAAVEEALRACQTEEDALFVLLQTESNLTHDEATTFRPIMRAKMKAATLSVLRGESGAER